MKVNNWTISSLLTFGKSCCVLCGAQADVEQSLCQGCRQDLVTDFTACLRCALPLPSPDKEVICGHCQTQPPYFRKVYSFALYSPPLDHMIQQLKFQQKLHYARLLGSMMAKDIVERRLDRPDLIIPVPLHRQRLRERGYNQALELARPIASQLRVPVDVTSCVRTRATQEQSGLHARQRLTNLKDAFAVSGELAGRRVAIFDDVMTTGSTVNELAKQLLSAGADYVDVWVCARVAEAG